MLQDTEAEVRTYIRVESGGRCVDRAAAEDPHREFAGAVGRERAEERGVEQQERGTCLENQE